MTRVLSLAIAALVVSTGFVQAVDFRRRGYDYENKRGHKQMHYECVQECTGSGWDDDIYNIFTGIFFGNFYTGGGADIYGALAVKGNFHAPGYVVNAYHPVDCHDLNSYNSYGLVVGGVTNTTDTDVHGSAYLSGGGTVNEVHILNNNCIISDTQGTGHFHFDVVENNRINTNRDFANLLPTLALAKDNSLTRLREATENNYEVFNFNACDDKNCGIAIGEQSNPDCIFFAEGNWEGVIGNIAVDHSKTYVFNIPVSNGGIIKINTKHPTQGFNPCRVIYNFYPVNKYGEYLASGTFTLIRRSANQLGGYTLAPRGHIVDGSVGSFSGNVVGLDYTWENLNAGVEIQDYQAAGGDCTGFEGCNPETESSCTVVIGTTETVETTETLTESSTSTTTVETTETVTESPSATTTIEITETVTESPTATTTATTTDTEISTEISIVLISVFNNPVTYTTTDTEISTEISVLSVSVINNPITYTTTSTATDTDTVTIGNPATITELSVVTDTVSVCTTSSVVSSSHSGEHHKFQDHSNHHHKEDEKCEEEDDEEDKEDKEDKYDDNEDKEEDDD